MHFSISRSVFGLFQSSLFLSLSLSLSRRSLSLSSLPLPLHWRHRSDAWGLHLWLRTRCFHRLRYRSHRLSSRSHSSGLCSCLLWLPIGGRGLADSGRGVSRRGRGGRDERGDRGHLWQSGKNAQRRHVASGRRLCSYSELRRGSRRGHCLCNRSHWRLWCRCDCRRLCLRWKSRERSRGRSRSR
jgi:hypothetical protein